MTSRCPFHNISNIHEFDALDEQARSNPWPYYDWLRDSGERTIYKLPKEDSFYVVHRFDDVKNVLTDTVNFSSEVLPTVKSPFFALMDGDDHKRIRNVVSALFSPKNLSSWESRIKTLIEKHTDRLIHTTHPELFKLWADAIPLGTLSLLFGLDGSDESILKLHRDAIAINRALFVTGGTGQHGKSTPSVRDKFNITLALIRHAGKIYKLRKLVGSTGMRELVAMLKPKPGNFETPRPDFKSMPAAVGPLADIMIAFASRMRNVSNNSNNEPISIFMDAVHSGEVSFMEMVMAGTFILFAGYETTASLLSNATVHLAHHPEIFRRLKENPSEIENFMEECLRYYTPVGRFLRRARSDVRIGGSVIPANAVVILLLGAANTDPEKFDDGCAFNMNRDNLHTHLSFGKGSHFCVGAPLARMQAMMALTGLIAKASSISIDESEPLRMVVDRDNGILRYEKVRLHITTG